MKGIKSFIKGMNKDATQSKQDGNTYEHADNLRVVTDEGLSSGSLENEKGHQVSFVVPDLAQMTLADSTVIPAQTNLQIIGWGTIVDTIVIFTTSETAPDPRRTTESYGQIWKLKFDESSGTVIGLGAGNVLTVANHLVYNQKVNFTSYHRIGRVVGRYENIDTQRVYWTDFYNSVRVINIADPNSLDIDLDNIDLIPGVNFTQPVVQSVSSGNLQSGTMIQFSYRLLDEGGAETLSAPVSALYPLPSDSLYSGNYGAFHGNTGGKSKSVTYIIKGIDTSYKTIEHIAVIYTAPNVYTVYKFKEQLIPSTGELTVVCDDVDLATILPNDEFNLLSSGFDRCKDIEVKDNRLIAANTITETFEPEFDPRAYRFNSFQDALLTDINEGDITIDGATKIITAGPGIGNSWTTIDKKHDAINPYNDESATTWLANNQYKYKANGTTLGGEGPNVSYEFVTKNVAGNYFIVDPTTSPDHVSVDRWINGDGDESIPGQLHADGTTYTIERTGQLKNEAGGHFHAYFTGHARGEVYRYALVLQGKRGSWSFADWIADIRFPDVDEGFPIQQLDGNGFPTLASLGLKFTIDISSIADKITGYSVVRVKREEKDKRRLGTGMLMYFDIQDDSNFNTLPHIWEAANDDQGADGLNASDPYQLTDDTQIFGTVENSIFHLADKPGYQDPQITTPNNKRFGYLLSPIGQLYGVDFKQGDFLKTTGFYEAEAVRYHLNSAITDPDDDKSYGFYYKLKAYQAPTAPRELYEISRQQIMQTGQYFDSGNSLLTGYTGVNGLMNASYSRDNAALAANKNVPLGLGSPKMAIMMNPTPTIPNATGDPATSNYNGIASGDYRTMGFFGDISSTVLFKEVCYGRYVTDQYGGNTYEARSQNQYQSTNHYQCVNGSIAAPLTTEVWGGDTYVNYYDDEQIQMYWNTSTAFGEPYKDPGKNKLSVAVCFPSESSVNADFREGDTWASKRDSSNMSTFESADYIYNFIWNQQNNTETKYFAKDFLTKITEEHPHQLWASETKTDGELIDRWRLFRVANKTEVNGIYGPINRIINWKNRLYFYQDMALGTADIDEKTAVSDSSGGTLTMGKGGVFPHYAYLSTTTGSYHQFDVIASANGLFHYDARLKKVFRFSGGEVPISDLKGMSSFFANEITGAITAQDYTLRDRLYGGPVGVHGEVDYRYNRVLFTFLKPYYVWDTTSSDITYTFVIGDTIQYTDTYGVISYYTVVIPFIITTPNTYTISGLLFEGAIALLPNYSPTYTVSYNEMIDAFESFYDYKPGLYLQYGRRLLSVSPFNENKAYEHNIGEYCKYYDQSPAYISRLKTILGASGNITKTFDNLEFQSELYDTNKVDIYNEPLSRYQVSNEYQDTGLIPFVNDNNIKRRMRDWRLYIGRDAIDGRSRIRSPWAKLTLEYDNNNNKRLVLHDVIYSYTPSPL